MKTTNLYIIEEHHEAFWLWNYCVMQGAIQPSLNTLLHVDYHSDFSIPSLQTSLYSLQGDLNAIKEFTYRELAIDCFIAPAIYQGIFNEIFWIGGKEDDGKAPSSDKVDILPINHDVRIMKQKRIEGYLQSRNKDGKHFNIQELIPKIKSFPYSGRKEFVYQYVQIPSKIAFSDTTALDIDLDYFSCCENPRKTIELKIEITKEAYELLHDPYHPVNLHIKRPVLGKTGERYFAYFNHREKEVHSAAKVDQNEILARVEAFILFLETNKVFPQIITICRSRHSGYTPLDQWEFIENNVIERLKQLYVLEVVSLQDIIR